MFSEQSSQTFSLFFTGEDGGRLEPCGCASGQLGGLSRRHTFIRNQSMNASSMLVLSNGDLLNGNKRQDEIKFQTLLDAMNQMKYNVLNVGEKELTWDLNFLKAMQSASSFTWLSSNVLDVEGKVLFGKVYTQKVRFQNRNIQTKVLGILSPQFQSQIPSDYKILNPVEVIRELISEEEQASTIWILLYHGDRDEARDLARSFPQIKLIITGHGSEEISQSEKVGPVFITTTIREAKYAGQAILTQKDNGEYSWSQIENIPLDEKIENSKELQTLMQQYQKRLGEEELFKNEENRTVSSSGNFLGSSACSGCHAKAFQIWKGTRHAEAYSSLIKSERIFDPDCLRCHTTGFQYKGGFKGEDLTSHLAFVGCESCHGPGGEHIKAPFKNRMLKAGSGTCMGCHDVENSPRFDFKSYWEKIKH